jgi:hypothetical protein
VFGVFHMSSPLLLVPRVQRKGVQTSLLLRRRRNALAAGPQQERQLQTKAWKRPRGGRSAKQPKVERARAQQQGGRRRRNLLETMFMLKTFLR